MARMIPPGFDPETRIPPGEVLIFDRLRSDPETSDWIVLHSLDVPQHRRQVEGEVDFVVVVPRLGVLCLEVKSHRTVSRSNLGVWHLGQDAPSNRGPFKQASGGMHAVASVSRDWTRAWVAFPSRARFASAMPRSTWTPRSNGRLGRYSTRMTSHHSR